MSDTPRGPSHDLAPKASQAEGLPRRGPAGDMPPSEPDPDLRSRGGQPQEDVEDRPVVGSVKPVDYPAQDRADSRP